MKREEDGSHEKPAVWNRATFVRNGHNAALRVRSTESDAPPEPIRLAPITDVPAFFASQDLEHFEQQGLCVSEQRLQRLAERTRDRVELTDPEELRIVMDGGNRGDCRLMLMGGFDACVFCTEPIRKGAIVALFACEEELGDFFSFFLFLFFFSFFFSSTADLVTDVPASATEDRSSMWVVDLSTQHPVMSFSSVRGGNIFRFMRNVTCYGWDRSPNVALEVVWRGIVPYCRSICCWRLVSKAASSCARVD